MERCNLLLSSSASRLTKRKINRLASREMDKLDKQFMNGKLSFEQYEKQVNILDKWASQQLQALAENIGRW